MSEDSKQTNMEKKGNFFLRSMVRRIGIVVVSAITVAGIIYYIYSSDYESTDDAFIDGHVIPISARVSGQVLTVRITDNEEVKKGQLLVEIDPRDYEARLALAQATFEAAVQKHQSARINVELVRITSPADVQLAQAGVDLAKAGIIAAQAQLAAAKSRLEQAQAQSQAAKAAEDQARAEIPAAESEVTRTENDLKRYQGVFATGVITPQQMDAAKSAAHTAQSNHQALRKRILAAQAQVTEAQAAIRTATENIHLAESQVTQAAAQVEQSVARLNSANTAPQKIALSESQAQIAKAEVAQAKANLQQAQLNLSYTKILAPEAGRITRKNIENGAYVQIGQPFFALVPKTVWVTANFKETQLTHMRPGQKVWVHVDAYSGKTFKGHVDSLQAGSGARFSLLPPENATGNYVKVVQRVPVKIVFDEQPSANYFLGPGMSAVPEVKVR